MSERPLTLDPDRLLPRQGRAQALARALYDRVRDYPIVSPHGHTDPAWFALDTPFENATDLLVTPDHYVLRMFYSQGIPLSALGVAAEGEPRDQVATPREAFRTFAAHWHLFRATPSRMWLETALAQVFGVEVQPSRETADRIFDQINDCLAQPEFRPRALLNRFRVHLIATTEGALDPLSHHATLKADGWSDRVVTTFRPDDVLNPDLPGFSDRIDELAEVTGEDTRGFAGYLAALRNRRELFRSFGATATDHGHPTAQTADLDARECQRLLDAALAGTASSEETERFRAQMLTEMAGMSVEDGMTMQLHPGSFRNQNKALFDRYGPDRGADIPVKAEFVRSLEPLLNRYGNSAAFKFVLYTLDESTYARELAPLAGHWPCLRLGPPWWFHDSPNGMQRHRQGTIETAGFYNTCGFNDDTRALLSIPARHDVARRMDARFLAEQVEEGRLDAADAFELIDDLTVNLACETFGIEPPALGV